MRRLAAALVLCAALAACSSSSSPEAVLQTKLNAVIDAGNNKDAATLRTAVGQFLLEVQKQSANGDITTTKAQDFKTVATRILNEASLLSGTPSPAASPSAQEESPSPEPSPSPEKPSPSPSPSPVEESPSPEPVASIGIGSPAASPTP